MYPEEMIAPMRKEITDMGFQELRTKEAAEKAMNEKKGTTLVFVNSVCGCAAGMARPGLALALNNAEFKPDNLYAVFAGNDKDATNVVRGHFHGYPPSSPCMALFKDSSLVAMVQRLDIEGHSAQEVANTLREAFNTHCKPEQAPAT